MAEKKPRTLTQFVRDKKREGCPVCALPPDVRKQLQDASAKKISRAVQLEWLKNEVGSKITNDQLSQHTGGRHDAQES